MDSHDINMRHADASRPALGFPLGTALLLLVIFCLSGVFSCCYHWDKLRALRRSFTGGSQDGDDATLETPSKSTPTHKDTKQKQSESLPVVMPGDNIAKYIAWPCPCEPPTAKITVEIQTPPQPS